MIERHLLAAAALLLAPGLASAQVYKCMDKNGHPQFVQTKPHDGSCAESTSHAPPPSGGNVDDLMKFSKEIDKERKQEARAQQKNEELEARRARRCDYSRRQLAGLQQTGPVFTIDENGQRQYLNKDNELRNAEQAVARDCN